MKGFRVVYTLLIFACLAGAAHAKVPWGLYDKTVEDTTFSIYAIDNLIDRRHVLYKSSSRVTDKEDIIFRNNINKWPAETLRIIQERGRTQEFRDIIPILENRVYVEYTPANRQPDIYVDVLEDPPCDSSIACFQRKGDDRPYSAIFIAQEDRVHFAGISLHEIGHYFGLGDQYDDGRGNSHPEYSSDVNQTDKSIMQGYEATNGELTCDDADGFINLLDLRLAQRNNGQFSARARNSWKSLCPKSPNIYQNGKTINRQAVDAWQEPSPLDDTRVIYQREYKNGEMQREMVTFTDSPIHIFQVDDKDRVKRDPKTHLILSVYTPRNTWTNAPAAHAGETASLTWEKHFTYGKPTVRNGKNAIPISVREVVNGKEIGNRQLFISSDGELIGDGNIHLTKDNYQAIDMGKSIGFKIENRRIIFYSVYDKQIQTGVRGFPTENVTIAVDHETRLTCSLPLQGNCLEFSSYWTLYETHRDHLMSFYRNFYEPLFNSPQQQQNSARKQIQDSIRSRRK